MNCSYFVYVKDFICNEKDPNMRYILNYKLSTSRNFIETKPQSLIEVPYSDEDEHPSIEFSILIIYANSEKNVSAKLRFEDCNLTVQNSRAIISLLTQFSAELDEKPRTREQYLQIRRLKSSSNTVILNQLKFFLIIEVKALFPQITIKQQDDEIILKQLKEEVQVFGIDVIGKTNFDNFIEDRRSVIEQQNMLKASRWFVRYRIDMKLSKQNYSVYLDDEDPTTVYYFFVNQNERNSTLILKLVELFYDDYTLEQNGYNQKTKAQLSSQSVIGKPIQINMVNYYTGTNQLKSIFIQDFEFFDNLKVQFKINLLKNNEYLSNFLGFTGIKVLETRINSIDLNPISMNFRLKTLDPHSLTQKWVLKTFDTVRKQTFVLNTWDFQHSLLINKLKKRTETKNYDLQSPISQLQLEQLFQQTEPFIILNNYMNPYSKEFTDIVKYYDHVQEYEKVIDFDSQNDDSIFSQRENHVLFKTYSPMDYIEIEIEGEPINSSNKQIKKQIIGSLSTSLFKVPQNQLIIGFIVKQKNGKSILKNCLAQFENDNDEQESQTGLDEILDNEGDELIGTIKYQITYQGYNQRMFQNQNWINNLSNSDFTPKSFINQMRSNISNIISQVRRQFIISLKLTELWNLSDLFQALGFKEEFELVVKIGKTSYSIPLTVTYENRRQIALEKQKQNIAFQLEKERKKCSVADENGKKMFYFIKDDEEVAVVTINIDGTNDMIFQINSFMDSFIVQLRQVQKESLYCFTAEMLRDLFFVQNQGFITVPMKLNVTDKPGITSIFFCKFQYKIVNENFSQTLKRKKGLYHFGIYVPQQDFEDTSTAYKARNELYEVSVQPIIAENSVCICQKQFNLNQQLIRFNIEKITGAEFWKEQNFPVRIDIKKIYSDFDDTFTNQKENMLKSTTFLINPDLSIGLNLPVKPEQSYQIYPNNYVLHEIVFLDKKLSRNNLKLILYIGMKCSAFIDQPKGSITIRVPIELQNKMIDSNIIQKGGQVKFKIQSNHPDSKKQKEQILIIGEKTDISLQTYYHHDSIVLEYYFKGKLTESDITRISELVLIPVQKYKELISFKQIPLDKSLSSVQQITEQNDLRLDELDEVNSILSDNPKIQINSTTSFSDDDVNYWSFFSFNDKRFEFYFQYISSMYDEEEEIRQQELIKKQEQLNREIEERNKQKQESFTNKSIDELKIAITKFQEDNSQIGTKIMKERRKQEKLQGSVQQLLEIEQKKQKEKSQSLTTTNNQNSNMRSLKPPSQFTEITNKAKELFQSICQCGAKNPKFNGFCADCVKKMREEYENCYKDYAVVAEEYETIFQKNMQIDLKMVQIKQKIANFKKRISYESEAVEIDVEERLLKDEIDFLKQQSKLTKAECDLLNNEFYRILNEKSMLQQELEKKINKKNQKLKNIHSQIKEFENKNLELEKIIKQNEKNLQTLQENL